MTSISHDDWGKVYGIRHDCGWRRHRADRIPTAWFLCGPVVGSEDTKEERSILRHTPICKQLDSVHVAAVVGG
jgi:hypothetical protein